MAQRFFPEGASLASDGTAILRYRQQLIDQHVRNATEIELAGYRVLAANCTCGEIFSEVAEALIGSWVGDEPSDCQHRVEPLPPGRLDGEVFYTTCLECEKKVRPSPFGVCWFDAVRENKRVYSLRSRGDFDVSAIAQQSGGGGHKSAAGFSIPYSTSSDRVRSFTLKMKTLGVEGEGVVE